MCVSLIGTWMQNIAQPWLAYTLTKSPLLLALVSAMQFLPMLFFSLFAGAIIDKLPKKKLLIYTQSASLVITLILAILTASGHIQYWHILVMATLLGIVNTLDMPARQAFLVELVEKEDLMNAIALNSSIFNLARIIGPALAGVIMGMFGVAPCFFINSVSFAAVIISLFFIKPLPIEKAIKKTESMLTDIKEGLKFIRHSREILSTIIMLSIVSTFAMNFAVLVPVFSKTVLGFNETGFGLLMSIMGVGSFLGAISIASMSRIGPQRFILKTVPYIIGTFLIVTGLTKLYYLTALGLALTGFSFVAFSSTANTTVQLNTSNELRGRIMSVYTLVFIGTSPIGNLFAGAITQRFGAGAGFIACGALVIILTLLMNLLKIAFREKRI